MCVRVQTHMDNPVGAFAHSATYRHIYIYICTHLYMHACLYLPTYLPTYPRREAGDRNLTTELLEGGLKKRVGVLSIFGWVFWRVWVLSIPGLGGFGGLRFFRFL